MMEPSWVSEKNNKGANVVVARVLEVEYVVGLLQNGYMYDHSISGNAESIGIIHVIEIFRVLFFYTYLSIFKFYIYYIDFS